jgi:hypothetical protein
MWLSGKREPSLIRQRELDLHAGDWFHPDPDEIAIAVLAATAATQISELAVPGESEIPS